MQAHAPEPDGFGVSEPSAGAEICPLCGSSQVRARLLALEQRWVKVQTGAPRSWYCTELRSSGRGPGPADGSLEQFVSGYYCDACHRAFVAEAQLAGEQGRRRL